MFHFEIAEGVMRVYFGNDLIAEGDAAWRIYRLHHPKRIYQLPLMLYWKIKRSVINGRK